MITGASDISDHLPVFAVIKRVVKSSKENNNFEVSRRVTQQAIYSFKTELMEQNWDDVYVENVNVAFEAFLKTFNSLYDKHCPLVYKVKNNTFSEKPWITKGIQKSCKKKNKLYRDFLNGRTKEAESAYKTYKTRLTSVMRLSKKNYFSAALEKNKHNIKNTWSVLNKLIKRVNPTSAIPTQFFTKDKVIINNTKEIANHFNNYFINIGPNLANEIVNSGQVDDALSKIPNLDKSIFIQATDENEILTIVRKCKGKKSADWNGLDMSVLKETIECVVKPITFVFNLSLQSGVFLEKMKIAKVNPIHKAGDKQEFTNYRPISILSQFSQILEKLFHKRLFNFTL